MSELQNQDTKLVAESKGDSSETPTVVNDVGISKADLYKGYLDTRKLSVESYLKVAQALDQVLTVWPISIVTGSVFYLRALSMAQHKEYLFICWILEALSLLSILWSMKNSEQAYAKAIEEIDEQYDAMNHNRQLPEVVNPWSQAAAFWESRAIWLMVIGLASLLVFVFCNQP
ncbi:MAG: hypothetical protein QG574_5418 [Cyanobacteriota bacterium erpe_2018_sw_21hr_WHONDRS-SW48-000092_B_bin.40]|jgi:hypothetical protein|nr:hypothetical protein [Cyanobacteriota bacterium erpe_2018_sw_21hr_WHONDRS-SW48-000092_B_bin.40]